MTDTEIRSVLCGKHTREIFEEDRPGVRSWAGWRNFSGRRLLAILGTSFSVKANRGIEITPVPQESKDLLKVGGHGRGTCKTETVSFACLSGETIAGLINKGAFDVIVHPSKYTVMYPKPRLSSLLRKDPSILKHVGVRPLNIRAGKRSRDASIRIGGGSAGENKVGAEKV